MSEKNLNFDTVIDRRGTNCLKYDFAVERGKPADILPLWVADMDFKTSSYIQSALADVVNHGIYGYSEVKDPYFILCMTGQERIHLQGCFFQPMNQHGNI